MKKLEDISKENIYKVPEGYFDKLPGVIQARVAKPESKGWFVPVFKIALPAIALVVAVSIWFTSPQEASFEDQLNEIQTEQLLAYLEESEIPADLITEEITWSEDDLYELQETVFSSMDPINITIEDLSVEPEIF